jgi:LuxR family transcriptional regulator/LuxR family quorum-sensing system transcriptional regulator CciR
MVQFACQQLHNRFIALHGPVSRVAAPALSAREREVLRWVALGKSNGDIAEILGISPHTVDTLVRRLFQKLGVSNRVSAALRAVGAGLVVV